MPFPRVPCTGLFRGHTERIRCSEDARPRPRPARNLDPTSAHTLGGRRDLLRLLSGRGRGRASSEQRIRSVCPRNRPVQGTRGTFFTGTATLFSARALRDVKRARSTGELPSGLGVYDVAALTEDNELTPALKHLGYRCALAEDMYGRHPVLPTTVARLFHQRLRWQRGALKNLLAYGMTRQALPWTSGRQLLTYVGAAFVPVSILDGARAHAAHPEAPLRGRCSGRS